MSAWELASEEEAHADASRRQFSLRTLLLAMGVLGAFIGIGVNTVRQIAIAMTPIEWRLLAANEVKLLSDDKRYVIVLRDIHQPTICGSAKEAYNSVQLRMDFHRWNCEAYYTDMSINTDAFRALEQRFSKLEHSDGWGWIYIENGKAISRSKVIQAWN